ncbi:alpha/beta fold hydrolase [uncultured Ramlibacter sp.]|uniref:esterase/lipase family protein n=1 Tax=uncultured Ramlibacter sp. TaxID=260755 RepID=UPI00260B5566|nr:alpha/beta fold hydrolase [uncultured Ramlibacter sp.]
MQQHSALARLQKTVTFCLLACALAWLAWHWSASPVLAVGGSMAILLAHALFLALEFVALYFVSRHDSTPPPSVFELAKAWLGEVAAAPLVFCWRQPFRWKQVPDHLQAPDLAGRRGVVFIHGFVCNRGFWTPWLLALRQRGHAFVAVNLEPVFGSIDDYAATIDKAVQQVTQATGMAPILVCHSMGGLAARAWLRTQGQQARVAHVITIGTPHRGTWLGRFSHLPNGRQMRLQSQWLGELGRGATADHHAGFTCWYSNCDNIVFPTSTATLPGADNKLVHGVAHVDMAFTPEVMSWCLARIAS